MGDPLSTAVVVLVVVCLFVVPWLIRHLVQGYLEEIGATWARRRDRRQRLGEATQAISVGMPPVMALARLATQGPPPDPPRPGSNEYASVRALRDALKAPSGPLHGRRPVFLDIGHGGSAEFRAAVSVIREITGHAPVGMFALGPEHLKSVAADTAVSSGHADSHVDSVLRNIGAEISSGRADALVVMMAAPITEEWESDAGLDVSALYARLFSVDAAIKWLTYSEPLDPSAWPPEVLVELPIPARDVITLLEVEGRWRPKLPLRDQSYVIAMSASEAVQFLLALCGQDVAVGLSTRRGLATPPYSAALALTLANIAPQNHVITRDLTVAFDIQAHLAIAGVRISGVGRGAGESLASLSVNRGQVVAWTSELPRDDAPGTSATSADWLEEAIADRDEHIAAAVLGTHGRAWIERLDAPRALSVIQRATQIFNERSAAGLWAHYLVALDSALRQDAPDPHWFDGPWLERAADGDFEMLYRAEQTEFTRLRGDLSRACALGTALYSKLKAYVPAGSASSRYSVGTAWLLLANLLRCGGRYEQARLCLDRATDLFDPSIPAHRIEVLHAEYATSVCDAMQGVSTVHATEGWPAPEALFARSLVTLANAHAAWFVSDHARAQEYAAQALDGFSSIGFQRYAVRTRRLQMLMTEWTELARTGGDSDPADPALRAIVCAPRGAVVTALRDMRPSRALGLLQFAMAFSDDPEAARQIALPSVIRLKADDTISLSPLSDATSFAQANRSLREAMGIGAETKLPLLVD